MRTDPGTPVLLRWPQPQDGQQPATHTFRIWAPRDAEQIEVSINGGPWQACRQEGRFWVCDWTGVEAGQYELRGRMRSRRDGKPATSFLHLTPGKSTGLLAQGGPELTNAQLKTGFPAS